MKINLFIVEVDGEFGTPFVDTKTGYRSFEFTRKCRADLIPKIGDEIIINLNSGKTELSYEVISKKMLILDDDDSIYIRIDVVNMHMGPAILFKEDSLVE